MNTLMAAVAAALLGLGTLTPSARAGEDCDNVTKAFDEMIGIAKVNLETAMGEVKKIIAEAKDEAGKRAGVHLFCTASGEFLGMSRSLRAVSNVCLDRGRSRTDALAALDASIRELGASIGGTCK